MHNQDLVSNLGNFVNRCCNLTMKFCDGVVPDCGSVPTDYIYPFDLAHTIKSLRYHFEKTEIQEAANFVLSRSAKANTWIAHLVRGQFVLKFCS